MRAASTTKCFQIDDKCRQPQSWVVRCDAVVRAVQASPGYGPFTEIGSDLREAPRFGRYEIVGKRSGFHGLRATGARPKARRFLELASTKQSTLACVVSRCGDGAGSGGQTPRTLVPRWRAKNLSGTTASRPRSKRCASGWRRTACGGHGGSGANELNRRGRGVSVAASCCRSTAATMSGSKNVGHDARCWSTWTTRRAR